MKKIFVICMICTLECVYIKYIYYYLYKNFFNLLLSISLLFYIPLLT